MMKFLTFRSHLPVNSMPYAMIALFLVTLGPSCQAQHDDLTEDEAFKIAVDAYIYGYPLITMEMTRRVMTNAATVNGLRGPMGQFINARQYPSPAFKDITAPNTDTLYSVAWLDLAKEPYVVCLPELSGRYYLMPMLSGWTDVFEVPGNRTTGTKPQRYAITGPGWKGTLPEGVTEYKCPTSITWVFGRTYCKGTPKDYEEVHALQDQYSIVPLSCFGKPYVPQKGIVDPDVDMKTPVRDQVNRMDVATFFQTMAKLMKDNPPAKDDGPMVEKMARIGIQPGHEFDINRLGSKIAKALHSVPLRAQIKIVAHIANSGKFINGWIYAEKAGSYRTDYLQRAFIAAVGLGANLPQDAVYPTSQVDSDGKVYDGANNYVIHFPKGQTPPVKGFWSLTLYDAELFLVANPLNRHALSSHFDFAYNDDGSLDLYIQRESPGKEKEANWLPSKEGRFILMLRMYWPEETPPSIIDGSWKLPPVRRVN